ncbi:hypothetical protein AB3329_00610 [Streptococcus sp. H31]|uniref:hypothetical protein n=1 Tax=Streptococcus huangxiaojuni TaxID=3237239 RepID=UPI0034A467CF
MILKSAEPRFKTERLKSGQTAEFRYPNLKAPKQELFRDRPLHQAILEKEGMKTPEMSSRFLPKYLPYSAEVRSEKQIQLIF